MNSNLNPERRLGGSVFHVTLRLSFALLIVFTIVSTSAFAQTGDKILSVNASQGVEGQPMTISAQLVQTPKIIQAILAYRTFGASQYKQLEATIMGNSASATIPGTDIAPGTIEYYYLLRVEGKDSMETYPSQNAEGHPLQVVIGSATVIDKNILFLSPDPGSSTKLEDLFVSISLIHADTSVNRAGTKIFIDDRDVSSFAVTDGDLINLAPQNITPPLNEGQHSIRVELYDNGGKLAHKASEAVTQVSSGTETSTSSRLIYNFSGQLEARNENISNVGTAYDRGTLNMTSQYDFLHVNGNLYLTNEEKDFRQPQNRYYIEGVTPYVKASYGDAYPLFPSLIMSGKRVRGFSANANLGFLHLDYSEGEITRKVEGDTITTFKYKNLQDSTAKDPTAAYGPFGNPADSTWAKYNYGTFTRNITVVRPSLGGDNFRWGFSYLHSVDDTSSIQHGIKPQEDLALGSDMLIAADDHHVEITGQFAASAYNQDIAPGNITDTQIDTLFRGSDSSNQRSNLRTIRDRLKQYITINENLVPLSTDNLNALMSYEGAMALNYFNNYVKGSYIFHGSQYNSFGQTYLQRDIKGYNVYDRIRLMQDQTFFSIGVERLQDNTDGSKGATTTYNNLNSTLSYFPRGNFPNVTIGYGRNARTNGLVALETGADGNLDSARFSTPASSSDSTAKNLLYSNPAVEDVTNRYFIQTSYDFNAMNYRHTLSFGVNISNRNDMTLSNTSSKNTSVSLALQTTVNEFLQTSISVGLNYNQIPMPAPNFWETAIITDYNYTNVLLGVRYFMLENNKLRISGMIGPTFGDFNRTSYDVNAEYKLYTNLSVLGDFNVLSNPGVSTDVIWSIILKYNM